MSIEERIAQFKNMVEADPENELGHFSLGKAFLESEQFTEAAASFQRVIEINAGFSRAYQHLAEAQVKTGDRDAAVATLAKGYTVAHDNGDMMPKNAMADMLRDLGVDPPVTESQAATATAKAADVSGDGFRCKRCGGPGPKLSERPFKGELGERILVEVCQPCWAEWIAMGTKVINEFRLDLSNPKAQELYDEQMKEFLCLG